MQISISKFTILHHCQREVRNCGKAKTARGIEHLKKQPPEMFHEKGALKSFAKFTGKHLCQSFSFKKLQACKYPEHLWMAASSFKNLETNEMDHVFNKNIKIIHLILFLIKLCLIITKTRPG